MNLWTGSYLWNSTSVVAAPFTDGAEVENVVIGAGITGALIADRLTELGRECAVVDYRPSGRGSTLASTAIVQYELDVPLHELALKIGLADAVRVYRLTFQAVESLKRLCNELDDDVGFAPRPALYLCGDDSQVESLRRELSVRREAGFEIAWLDGRDIASRYPWRGPAALYNEDACVIDPVALTTSLLQRAQRRGMSLYRTGPIRVIDSAPAGVTLRSESGEMLRCRRVIVAGGYETSRWLPRLKARLTSSYAGATDPGQTIEGWHDDCVVWGSERPYFYLRRTGDGRVVIGGLDKPFRNALLRDMLLPIERLRLQRRLRSMLGNEKLMLSRQWTGTFAESSDGMPVFCSRPDLPGVLFIFACGGNGTTFGSLARNVAADWIAGRDHECLRLFSLDRASL